MAVNAFMALTKAKHDSASFLVRPALTKLHSFLFHPFPSPLAQLWQAASMIGIKCWWSLARYKQTVTSGP